MYSFSDIEDQELNSLLTLDFKEIIIVNPIVVLFMEISPSCFIGVGICSGQDTFLFTLFQKEARVKVCRSKHLINHIVKVLPSKCKETNMLQIDELNQSER